MIKFVRMQNCQSFVDVVYPLAIDRLNVIVAENDTGKSILYKVLKLAGCADYYSKADRCDLIRRGSEYAQVMFQFTDDSMAAMRIQRDGVMYCWMAKTGDPFSWQLEPPTEMIDRLGLLVSSSEAFIANIVDMDQGLLLVDSRLSSNYELVKLLATCEDLDLVMERVDPLIKEYRDIVIRENDSLNMIEGQLSEMAYVDIEKLKEQANAVEAAIQVGEICCSLTERLGALPERGRGKIDFDDAIALLESLGSCIDLAEVLGVLVEVPKEIDTRPFTVLEILELTKERLEKIHYSRELVVPSLVDSLSSLTRIRDCVNSIECNDTELVQESLVDNLECITSIASKIKGVQSATTFDNTIRELEQLFSESGQTVDCPLFGKVVFDGKECVADS